MTLDADALHQQLADRINQAFATGLIDSNIRTLLVSLDGERSKVTLYAFDEWSSDHPYTDDERAFADISTSAWLDELDALTVAEKPTFKESASPLQVQRKPPRFSDRAVDAAVDALRTRWHERLREAALRLHALPALQQTPEPVGIFLQGVIHDDSGHLLCIAHPNGRDILPIRQRQLPGYSSDYVRGALVPDGLQMFYVGRDGGDESREHLYRWDDIDFVMAGKGRRDAAHVRFKGNLHGVEFSHGHVHEEFGHPPQNEIDRRINQHFQQKPALLFRRNEPPAPTSEPFDQWLERYLTLSASDRLASQTLRSVVELLGLDAAATFVERIPEEERAPFVATYASNLFGEARWSDCLAAIETVEGEERGRRVQEELGCLWELGRFDDVLERADIYAAGERAMEFARCVNPIAADKLVHFRLMALAQLGRLDDAQAIVADEDAKEKSKANKRMLAYGKALLAARQGHGAEARAHIRACLEHGDLPRSAARDFADTPELADVLAACESLTNQRSESERSLPPAPATTKPDWNASEWSATSGDSQWNTSASVKTGVGTRPAMLAMDKYWVVVGKGIELYTLSRGQFELVGRVEHANSLGGPAIRGNFLYAADHSRGLLCFDLSKPAAPALVDNALTAFQPKARRVEVGDGFLALIGERSVQFYDLANPAAPALRACLGSRYIDRAVVVGPRLYLGVRSEGVVIYDLSNPSEPIALGRTPVLEDEHIYEPLAVVGSRLLVRLSNGLWCVDIADPTAPKTDFLLHCRLSDQGSFLRGDHLVFESDGYLDLDLTTGEVAAFELRKDTLGADDDDDDEAWELNDSTAEATFERGPAERVAHFHDRLMTLQRGPSERQARLTIRGDEREFQWNEAERPPAPDDHLDAVTQAIVKELHDAAEKADTRIGRLGLTPDDSDVYIAFSGPRSPIDFENGTYLSVDLADHGLGTPELARSDWPKVVTRLLVHEGLRQLASGRLYVALRDADERRWVVAPPLVQPEKDWTPQRATLREFATKSVADLLSSDRWYKEIDTVAARAAQDDAVRLEVAALANQGMWAALRTTMQMAETEPSFEDLAIECSIAAATRFLEVGDDSDSLAPTTRFLRDYARRDDVRGILEKAFETDDPYAILNAAKGLNRLDHDKGVASVRQLIEQQDASSVFKAHTLIPNRLPELLEDLQRSFDLDALHSHELGYLCAVLFKAGLAEAPAQLREAASRDIRDEQYHGDSLFSEDTAEQPAPHALRLWRARSIAERASRLIESGDAEASLYPPDLEPEPYASSWGYLWEALVAQLDAKGETTRFVDALRRRALPGEAYAADRSLMLAAANHYVQNKDWAGFLPLARAAMENDGAFDEKDVRKYRRTYYQVRLQQGWDTLKAGDLAAARDVAVEAVRDQPNDGQVLFFDARLTWLESSPEKAIDAVTEHLKRVDQHDSAGRGRLYNLAGCALDELGRPAEAVPWFEKAAKAHAAEPMYLANLAECYEKMGDLEQARHWALEARRKGSESELVRRLATPQ